MLKDTGLDDIRAVVTLYLDGMIWGQPDKLRQPFRPNASGHFMGRSVNAQCDRNLDGLTLIKARNQRQITPNSGFAHPYAS